MHILDLSSNGRLRATGKDRVRFLNGLFSNDVAALRPGQGCHAAMISVKGRTLADAILYADEDAIGIELAPTLGEKVRELLERHLIVDEVEIADVSAEGDEVLFLGAEGAARVGEALGLGASLSSLSRYGHVLVGGARVMATFELGQPGLRVTGGARALAERLGGAWLGADEVEVLRVEAGEPRYGVDSGEEYLPLESRLDDAIAHTKGCYMGQEVIARVTARGHVNKRLMGLRLDGEGAAPTGAKLSATGREDAGLVTSSVVSPRLGPIALAYVHRTLWAPGTRVSVADGAGARAAEVVELPFSSVAGT